MTSYENGSHEDGESYEGAARIGAVEVSVQLRGHFEPIDGLFHWYGRIAQHDDLDAAHSSGSTVELQTPHGSASGRISDLDPWGRFRIAGTGRPPF